MSAGGTVGGGTRSFGERLIGALKLDASVYEEVEHDTSAFGQAATVVALSSIAQGIGAYQQGGLSNSLFSLAMGFVGWFIATGLVWLIGVKIMNCTSDYAELLRTLGFASVPGVLGILGVLPLGALAGVLSLAILVLSVIAWVIAARQALDVSTGRAIVICVIAELVPAVLLVVLGALLVGLGVGVNPGSTPGAMGF